MDEDNLRLVVTFSKSSIQSNAVNPSCHISRRDSPSDDAFKINDEIKSDTIDKIGISYDNILYVAQGDSNDWLLSDEALITDVNWISSKKVEGDFDCTAKFRYRQKDNDVSIRFIDDTTIYVTFKKPVKAVTPGQAAVFYDGDVCLGGGTIEKVYKDNKEIEYL